MVLRLTEIRRWNEWRQDAARGDEDEEKPSVVRVARPNTPFVIHAAALLLRNRICSYSSPSLWSVTMPRRSRALWDNVFHRPDSSRWEKCQAWARAVAYECHPGVDLFPFLRGLLSFLQSLFTEWLPSAAQWSLRTVRNLSRRQWSYVAAVLAYYLSLRVIHHYLEAGPLVLIGTALVLIFTVGLSDSNDGSLSAYAVFNRGFQRLLGSVDADALVAQHVGGGFVAAAGMNEERVNNIPRRAQREEPEIEEEPPAEQQPRARGKKGRRRRIEQRREMQRQRQAAREMGFGDDDAQNEQAALRLLDQD